MSENTRKVLVGGPNRVTGTMLYGIYGTPVPVYADAATAITGTLDPDLRDCGFVGEDGVTKGEATSFSSIKEFGGKTIARILSDYNATFTVTLMEFNEHVAKLLYGDDNVTVIGESGSHGEIIAVRAGGGQADSGVFVLQLIGLNDQRTMFTMQNAQVTTIGDQSFTRTAAASHQVTIETLPDEDGYDFYMFVDDRVIAVAAVPTITSVLPAGESVGEHVTIKGTRFMAGGVALVTGASGVTIDGINATDYTVVDKNTIVATIPVAAAGAAAVIVTNATGASAPTNYTVV